MDKKGVAVSLYDADSDVEEAEVEDGEFRPLVLLPPTQPLAGDPHVLPSVLPSAQRLLERHCYDVVDLVGHIRRLDGSHEGTVVALEDVWKKRGDVDLENVLSPETYVSQEHQLLYANATYEVYDVGKDALAVQQHDDRGNDIDQTLEAATVWNTLKVVTVPLPFFLPTTADGRTRRDINLSGDAVGRMT